MEDLKYWLGFSLIRTVGPVRFALIKDYFNDLNEAWHANLPELMSAGFPEKLAESIIIERSEINLDQELEKLSLRDIKFITIENPIYPKMLKEIYDPPFVLYYLGDIKFLNDFPCLSIVGSRKHTVYAQQVTADIVADLVAAKINIISGLALGVDALAHQAALNNHGLTAAILGSDLDWENIGPKTNFNLAKQMLTTGGTIISEFPLGTAGFKGNFPQRNRIVSGLSQGVLIVEAGENSGSSITANCALDQGRDVYAVPGSIYNPCSFGTNLLIKKGAKLVTSAQDILEDFELEKIFKKTAEIPIKLDNPEEETIINFLTSEASHIDKIAQTCNIRINVLSSTLMTLTMKGLIKDLGGGNYIKKK